MMASSFVTALYSQSVGDRHQLANPPVSRVVSHPGQHFSCALIVLVVSHTALLILNLSRLTSPLVRATLILSLGFQ